MERKLPPEAEAAFETRMMDDPELLAVVEASTALYRRHHRRARIRTVFLCTLSAVAGVVACITIGSSLLHRDTPAAQSAQLLDLGFTRGSRFEQQLELRPGVEALVVRIDVGIPETERYNLVIGRIDTTQKLWTGQMAVDSEGFVAVALPASLFDAGRYSFLVADDVGELGTLLVSIRIPE